MPPPRTPTLELPGWDDIIHIQPDWMLTPQAAADRKKQRAIRISQSPVGEIGKATTWLMTQIDNIQDMFVTASVALRLGALAVPQLKPLALLAGKAADTINLANLAKPSMAARTKGKRGMEGRLAQSPGYYAGRVKNATRLRSALPNIPEVLQILQTSDQLTGIGISLGGIMAEPMGAIADLLTEKPAVPTIAALLSPGMTTEEINEYLRTQRPEEYARAGTITAAYGLATLVSLATPGTLAIAAVAEALDKFLPWKKAKPADTYREAARVLDGTPWCFIGHQILSPEDHLTVSLALHVALQITAAQPVPGGLAPMAQPHLGRLISTRVPTDPVTRWALREAGVDPDDPGKLPLEGSPSRSSLRDIQAELQEVIPANLPRIRADQETEASQIFAGALDAYAAAAPWSALEGSDAQFKRTFSNTGRALITLMDYAIQIPHDFPDPLVHQLLEHLSAIWYKSGTWQPDPRQAQKDFDDALAKLLQQGPQHPARE
jgi:hypothetical protein